MVDHIKKRKFSVPSRIILSSRMSLKEFGIKDNKLYVSN